MRALILHANKFQTNLFAKSTWPKGIEPETRNSSFEQMKECLVVFFCVEEGDTEKRVDGLYKEILKASDEVKTANLMIAPFVHLSKNIAKPNVAKELYAKLMNKLANTTLNVKSSHFGYHKSLLLDVKGHPGSFRYREFY